MTIKIKFTVEPSEDHDDVLTIQDAFEQAIDFFDLLTDEADKNVVWKLQMASTNSPFTCEGEPVDVRTWAGAHATVAERVSVVERNLARIASGMDFDETFPKEKVETARKLVRRNTNGIGKTIAQFREEEIPLEITQEVAVNYFERVLRPTDSLHSYLFSGTSRQEHGSVEGRIAEIGTDYDAPAICVVESKSGRKIWCRVDLQTAGRMGSDIRAGDAWDHRRVRVRGVLNYDAHGKTTRLVEGTVAFVPEKDFDIDKLSAPGFTEGYSV